ncbi:unnamed protein product [[Candida] boidinii]|uniref:tRNA wybutosine-synthesizing protein 2 n=1 Tax=Candida boidinii TaxID=5477 RepID=A0A9W6SUI7_CANBO|nr:transferase activity protein [[Candida] boidinii]GME66699.1 unnamed protein product [[Candida] boidinii]
MADIRSFEIVLRDSLHIKTIKTFLESEKKSYKKSNKDYILNIYKIIRNDKKIAIPISINFDINELSERLSKTTGLKNDRESENDQIDIISNCDFKIISGNNEETQLKIKSTETSKFDFKQLLLKYVKETDTDTENVLTDDVISILPSRWSLYPPLLLLPSNTFETDIWVSFVSKMGGATWVDEFYKLLLAKLTNNSNVYTHIAINKPIVENSNVMRVPVNLLPVYGDFSINLNHDKQNTEISEEILTSPTEQDFNKLFWCTSNQNGITQFWCPVFTMFSRGNIKEKIRILQTFKNIENNYIIDLYSGIGYFTLCYLKKNCKRIFCWELNPWSIKGLVKGAIANKFKYMVTYENEDLDWSKFDDDTIRLVIFQESNEYAIDRFNQILKHKNNDYKIPITHINLGLLPSSKLSWPIASSLIKDFSSASEKNLKSQIHIHENVGVRELDNFMEITTSDLTKINGQTVEPVHLEKVKTYAPDVWHIVGDFSIS